MDNRDMEKAEATAVTLEGRPGALDLVEAARLIRELCREIESLQESIASGKFYPRSGSNI